MEKFSSKSIKKFYVKDILINSSNYKKDFSLNIVVISDMHFHEHVDKDLFRLLILKCKELKPDYIVMTGDQVEDNFFLNNKEVKNYFESIIKELSTIAPLIMIPGNHDISKCNNKEKKDAFFKKDTEPHYEALEYYDSLNKIKNVYYLNNKQIEINGINFMGFSPRHTTYFHKGDKKTNQYFIDDYLSSGLKVKEESFNILLTHSPIKMTQRMVLNAIEDFSKQIDLVITGHLHDGYLPKKLDKLLGNTKFGLFLTPIVPPIPGMLCRGLHNYGRGHLFISQGFRKWTLDTKFYNYLETKCANDIERLIISNSKDIMDKRKHI